MTENTVRTLDWLPKWDERNQLFAVSAMDCFQNGVERARVRRKKSVWLDQGTEGACTGFGTAHVLASDPLRRPAITNEVARGIYLEAQLQDEWPGEAYSGSSVNGAMKAAQLQGYVRAWRWCQSLIEVRHALAYHGPLVLGVNWYEGMFEPDFENKISPVGEVLGGHALMLSGFKDDYYRLENSWGSGWGDNGGCWIDSASLQRLLEEDGEFACPEKIPF